MVFESVTDRLGGKQAKRVIDLVDDLWDSRKKIVEMVDFVWDNRSAISGVIDFVQEHQERITDVVSRLPDLVGTAGVGLEAAGSGAQRASLLLAGDDDNSPRELSATAATALERCQEQLVDIAGLLGELGDGLDRVRIPTISADRTEVMGFSLISGVDIGERPLLDVASKRVSDGAAGLVEVAGNLADVASRFRRLGVHLADVGVDLGDAGEQLSGSGTTLRSFVDDPPTSTKQRTPARKKPARKKPATKKPAQKKPAQKKRATKKPATKKKTVARKKTVAKKTATKRATKQRSTIMPNS
ncbi:MAG: hypothetical protein AB8G14_06405 [Ilumatobacter sp.]